MHNNKTQSRTNVRLTPAATRPPLANRVAGRSPNQSDSHIGPHHRWGDHVMLIIALFPPISRQGGIKDLSKTYQGGRNQVPNTCPPRLTTTVRRVVSTTRVATSTALCATRHG